MIPHSYMKLIIDSIHDRLQRMPIHIKQHTTEFETNLSTGSHDFFLPKFSLPFHIVKNGEVPRNNKLIFDSTQTRLQCMPIYIKQHTKSKHPLEAEIIVTKF